MSEKKKTPIDNKDDSGKRFDMYRFFSRKDVIFATILILALLIYLTIMSYIKTSAV
jgi:hypothetical protein